MKVLICFTLPPHHCLSCYWMILRCVEADAGATTLSSHHVTVCLSFMSSGEMSWAWYVTKSSLSESNKSPTAVCTALCLCAMIPFPSVESSSAMCPLSAAHLLPNLQSYSLSHVAVSLLCSLKRNAFNT